MLSPRCTSLMLLYLTWAGPLTALVWGGFWLWRSRTHAIPMAPEDRRFFWVMVGCSVVILAELSVLGCVAGDRPRP